VTHDGPASVLDAAPRRKPVVRQVYSAPKAVEVITETVDRTQSPGFSILEGQNRPKSENGGA
jgi:hypothetical protein